MYTENMNIFTILLPVIVLVVLPIISMVVTLFLLRLTNLETQKQVILAGGAVLTALVTYFAVQVYVPLGYIVWILGMFLTVWRLAGLPVKKSLAVTLVYIIVAIILQAGIIFLAELLNDK